MVSLSLSAVDASCCIRSQQYYDMSFNVTRFPLYVKGNKERFLFDYGVFLLNKNIAHLRYVCGQGTADIRTTLQNVKLFMEERIGARLLLER